MRTKGHNQSKFMRIITLPIKALGKARDLYVKSLTNCSMGAGRHGQSMAMAGGRFSAALPRSFSTASSTARSNESDDYRELVRAASVRSLGHKNEMEMYVQMQQMMMMRKSSSNVGSDQNKLPKSTSAGMGFMGRIDEDCPCDFEDVGVNKGKGYPRSRSYAVANRSVGI